MDNIGIVLQLMVVVFALCSIRNELRDIRKALEGKKDERKES